MSGDFNACFLNGDLDVYFFSLQIQRGWDDLKPGVHDNLRDQRAQVQMRQSSNIVPRLNLVAIASLRAIVKFRRFFPTAISITFRLALSTYFNSEIE